jgi:hypothetical protein
VKKSVAAKWSGVFLFLLSYPVLAVVGAMIVARVLGLFQDVKSHADIVHFLRFEASLEKPLQTFFHLFMPTVIGGRDITAFLAGAALYGIYLGMRRGSDKLKELSGRLQVEEAASTAIDREKLLEVYSEAKSRLEELKRPLAFLSMDVVDSTGIKKGEDSSVAERDFRRYKQMVEKCLAAEGVLKSTWTPDGVMACFDTAAAAVRAGRNTIAALAEFNASIKKMRGDFKIRAGVNAGPVLYDERTPMEEMSDRVIDVAGHCQKYGSVNAILAPTEIVSSLSKEFPFKPAGRSVDGLPVSEWSPVPAPKA